MEDSEIVDDLMLRIDVSDGWSYCAAVSVRWLTKPPYCDCGAERTA